MHAGEQRFTKWRLIVEAAFLKATLKTSRTPQELRFKKERVADLERRVKQIEKYEEFQKAEWDEQLVSENSNLMKMQDSMKQRRINRKARVVDARRKQ